MTHDEIDALATSFFDAIEAGDVDMLRRLYSPDATIWHNYDGVDQDVERNLAVLAWIVRNIAGRRYDEVRRIVLDDGFVQQHVLRGEAPGGRLEIPAMMRVMVAEGKVTRIEEYLDTAQTAVLTSTPAPAR